MDGVTYTLYFGRADHKGTEIVDEREWNIFLRDVVTPVFPNGFTVYDGHGQWKPKDGSIKRERTKVLEIVADPAHAEAIGDIAGTYAWRFKQECVLVTSTLVGVSFVTPRYGEVK